MDGYSWLGSSYCNFGFRGRGGGVEKFGHWDGTLFRKKWSKKTECEKKSSHKGTHTHNTRTRHTRTHEHTNTQTQAHEHGVCKLTHHFSQGCDFRESSPRPSEQPKSRRGTSISRPLSYVGGAAVREDRRLHLVPVFRHTFHIAFDVVATAVRSEATRQTPKPKRKIDRQTRRQSRTKPLSVTAVRKALRGETHRGGEETRDAKPHTTQRARRALARE